MTRSPEPLSRRIATAGPGGGVAERLRPVVEQLLGDELRFGLQAWDGSRIGPADGPAVVVRNRRALRHLVWSPNELGLGRAYVSGDLELTGDVGALLALATAGPDRPRLAVRRRQLAGTLIRLGALGPRPPFPPEEARVVGRLHSRTRDTEAIRHHYDVSNDFYRLLLGDSMVYSCGYYAGADYTLADAQLAKCDLISRKLDLRPGMRLLDVGCGWGTMAIFAAQNYGVEAVGVTISPEQADLARKRVAEAGLTDRVEIRLQDYRDIDDGPYDAISSIGMAEHVGDVQFAEYAQVLYRLVRPGGRLLNHQITQASPRPANPRTSFGHRYVFPDGELLPVGTVVGALENAGLEVRDVESLREHYVRTLAAWAANLAGDWATAERLSSPGRARVWRLYLAAAELAFRTGRISISQVLAVRRRPGGAAGMPPTRADWLLPAAGPAQVR